MWWLEVTENPLFWQQLSAHQGLTAQLRQWLRLTGADYGALMFWQRQPWLVAAERPLAQWQLDYFSLCQRFEWLLILHQYGDRTRILYWCAPFQLYVGEVNTQQLLGHQEAYLKPWLTATKATPANDDSIERTCVLCQSWRSRLQQQNWFKQCQLSNVKVMASEPLVTRASPKQLLRSAKLVRRGQRMDILEKIRRHGRLGLLLLLLSGALLLAIAFWRAQQQRLASTIPEQAIVKKMPRVVESRQVATAADELRQLRRLLLQSLAWPQWQLLGIQRSRASTQPFDSGWQLHFVATTAAAAPPSTTQLAAINHGDITLAVAQGELNVTVGRVALQRWSELQQLPLWRLQKQLQQLLGQPLRRQAEQLQVPLQQALPDTLAQIADILDGQALTIGNAQLQVSRSQLQGLLELRRVDAPTHSRTLGDKHAN
ncbi:hypothetical protein [Idiomarina xiamenensis]|uniref:Uncharacterized protein n=1 Tax=Idiomarina xiamenensis 10-D-4 TaxID=740709 RepID=K2K7Z9_9GAMM|nr:hypothetical protein [Idiomarina xiamenensis]EKE83828.1 hypothetical protein A10D4_06771 [Idiomarina xiamenensis 10-D-4]